MGGPQGGGTPVVPGIQRFVVVMGNIFQPFLARSGVSAPRAAHTYPVDITAHMGASKLCY